MCYNNHCNNEAIDRDDDGAYQFCLSCFYNWTYCKLQHYSDPIHMDYEGYSAWSVPGTLEEALSAFPEAQEYQQRWFGVLPPWVDQKTFDHVLSFIRNDFMDDVPF